MASSTGTSGNQMTVEQLLSQYATGDAEKFAIFFRRMRGIYPKDCMHACIRYLGDSEGTPVSRQMLLWLCSGVDYCPALFDPEIVSGGGARQAAVALRDSDPQFFTKLSRFLQDSRSPKTLPVMARILHVIPALGDCGVAISWLRTLETHSDDQIRLQSAKALCEMRPTRAMVERQLQSSEGQTRADALEAFWKVPGTEAKTIFRFALADPDHRVVAKALVGLHLNNDTTAVEKMIELSKHRSAMFRLSMAAAMALTADRRAVAALQELLHDSFPAVREAARVALVAFPAAAAETRSVEHEQQPPAPEPVETPVQPMPEKPRERTAVAFETPAFRLL